MVRRPAPPSSSLPEKTSPAPRRSRGRATPPRERAARPTVSVGEWASGIRLSTFAVVMLSLVVLGAWVLVPTVGTYLDQRQKIVALEAAVQLGQTEIDALMLERERWQDPAYITAQARQRLYYVRPGEVVYLVDNNLDDAELPAEQAPVSDQLSRTSADWAAQLLRSLTEAGLARTAAVDPAG